MGYRERRREARAYSRQRTTALGFALLSGHGAALFVSILTPFQLIGRIPNTLLGAVWLLGGIAALAFGLGAAAAWNGLNADGQGMSNNADSFFENSMKIAMGSIVVAVAVFGVAGLSILSSTAPAEPAAPIVVPADDAAQPTPARTPG
jgi:hypothetical protein